MIVKVLLPLPFDEPFDYKTDLDLSLGQIVKVPFGKETIVYIGYLSKGKIVIS